MSTIGAVLPLALGVIVSPIPIGAALALMLAPRGGRLSAAYLLGWTTAILGLTVGACALAGFVEFEPDGLRRALSVLQLGLGALLLGAGLVRVLRGGRAARRRLLPLLDRATAPHAGLLGLGMGVLNPKLLLIAAIAGATIAAESPEPGIPWLAAGAFSAVAAIGVAAPVLARAFASSASQPLVLRARTALAAHEAAITGWACTGAGALLAADAMRGLIA
jgi:hypothetical protein